jgi:hypothetical protein
MPNNNNSGSAPGGRIDTAALLARVDIVELIDGYVPLTKQGAEYVACCPFHSEASPSFKVNRAKQIYHCFGCGANGDAIKFLQEYAGLSFIEAVRQLGGDLPAIAVDRPMMPKIETRRTPWLPVLPARGALDSAPKAHVKRGLPEHTWVYRGADQAVLGIVMRFKTSDGGKEVLPVVWARNDDTGAEEWRWMAFPEPRPLYGLDRLAARPEATVLLVEGEKCADAAHAELPDMVVVSWPGGGKADGKVDWSPLAGRKVITWADADAKRVPLTPEERAEGMAQRDKPLLPEDDQPGVATMARIRERLVALDCRVWNVKLPPPGAKPDGWDVADAVNEGLCGAELAEYLRAAVRSTVPSAAVQSLEQPVPVRVSKGTPPSAESDKKRSSAPLLLDASEWLADSLPPEYVVEGIVQRGTLCALTAVTNHGKTAVSLALAVCVATGRKFAGKDIQQGRVLILCGENPDGFRTRLQATLQHMGLERGDVAGLITVLPLPLAIGNYVEQIVEEGRKLGGEFALVLVDTSVSYFGGDNEDDNLQARNHAWHLRALVELPGHPAIIANCHPTKNADKENLLPRGGGAFLNEIDVNLTVWAEGESATFHWFRKKRGPDFEPIPFEFVGMTIDEHGVKVPAVVAVHITDDRADTIRRQRSQEEDRLLYALLHHPDESYPSLASHCGWPGDKAKSKVNRVMSRLRDDQLVKKYRGHYVLTPTGKNEAERIR